MTSTVALPGLRATTLAGYLGALGMLRIVTEQRDPGARLSWQGDLPVLHHAGSADELAAWLMDAYRPGPIVSPWNAGSGFAGNGKSPAAEEALAMLEAGDDPRLAGLRAAIAAGREVVRTGRERGWAGETMWAKKHKQSVIALCRNTFPDDALAWIDVAAVLNGPDVHYNPLTGSGGNFGRQDWSVTYLQHLAQVLGPKADRAQAAAWAHAALTGAEDVPYQRGAVGQFDPGRAAGILASIWGERDKEGFANPWRTILTCEGLLLFASAAVRRNAASPGAAWPFTVHATPVGHPTACAGEDVKGEVWAPLWERPVRLPELERLFGEGRAQWGGAQARDGLLFALAVSSLGVDRNITFFRRFVIALRLGQNPIAFRANDVTVALRDEQALLADPYLWLSRLRRRDRLPAGVGALLRRCDDALFSAVTGTDPGAMARFVAAFGQLHEAVARSGTLRSDIPPYQPRTARSWNPPAGHADRPELQLASAFASLADSGSPSTRAVPALRTLLTRVERRGRRLAWTNGPATGIELLGPTLTTTLAHAHRLRLQALNENRDGATPSVGFTTGQTVALGMVDDFLHTPEHDDLTADYLRGLLTLGWIIQQPQQPYDDRLLEPALCALLPFYGTTDYQLVSDWNTEQTEFTAILRPRPDWIARLLATGPAGVVDDALLRLRLAGCRTLITPAVALGTTDGTRPAAALLLRVATRDRIAALRRAAAVKAAPRPSPPADAAKNEATATV